MMLGLTSVGSRRADRPRPDPALRPDAAPRRRHRRLPRRDPAVERRPRALVSGNVDFGLMGNILLGSLPGVSSARTSSTVPPTCCARRSGCVLLGGALGVPRRPASTCRSGRSSASPRSSAPSGAASTALAPSRRASPALPAPRRPYPHELTKLTHLQALEAEAIHVMREVAAELREARAAVLRRQGLDRPAAPRREGVPARRGSRSR